MNFKELGAKLGLQEHEYRELIELFVTTGSADFEKIKSGLATGDADRVMRSAHTIKGAAGNLGLIEVSDMAKNIEESARNNQLHDLESTVTKLKTHFDAIDAFVKG